MIEKTWVKVLISIAIASLFILIGLILYVFSIREDVVKQFSKVQRSQFENTIFYDSNGQPFHIIRGEEDRRYVELSGVSRNLQKAVVAIEDSRYFNHFGIDVIRLTKVTFDLFIPGRTVQGASTITQQLIKLSLLTPERKISRKIKEIFMAMALETRLSKNKILEFYLNKVYLGNRNYGVENAARNYLGKSSSELSLAESAFIAGLIKKPEGYSPFQNIQQSRKRQLIVLRRMLELGWVSRGQFREAVREKIVIKRERKSELQLAPYFSSHIMLELIKRYGSDRVYGGGLRVYTTLDRKMQTALEESIAKRAARYRTFDQLAGVSLDPASGFVRALVGGLDYHDSEFNRATQAKRQPGSSFKPILYAAALTTGVKANDVFIDEPTSYTREVDGELEIYEPANFSEDHLGPITMAHALRVSNNVVSVKILKQIGYRSLLKTARRFGLEIPIQNGLCLALGCGEVTLLDLVSAYGTFANGGVRQDPVFILKVTDSKGNLLEEYVPLNGETVLSPEQNFQMVRMLQDVVEFGTGRAARIREPSGGKTGTSDRFRDAWFIGFTPELVTGFWAGNDDNRSMTRVVGGGTPARLWKAYMQKIPTPPIRKNFPVNEHFEDYKVCIHSGQLAGDYCPETAWYSLRKDLSPLEYCGLHTGPGTELKICTVSGQLATPVCPPTLIESKKFYAEDQPTTFCEVHQKQEPAGGATHLEKPAGAYFQKQDVTSDIRRLGSQ